MSKRFFHLVYVRGADRAAPRRHAVTLIETMAALLLVAIALPVAMRGVSVAAGAADSARRRSEAAALAQSKMAQIVVNEDWKRGGTSGEFAAEWSGYRWESTVGDWTFTHVTQLDVTVSWDARGQANRVTLSTLVYDPPEDMPVGTATGGSSSSSSSAGSGK